MKWLRKRSLVFRISMLLLMILLLVIITMLRNSYSSTKEAIYQEYLSVALKLKDQVQWNYTTYEKAFQAASRNEPPPEVELAMMKNQLDAMVDNELITNAYLFTSNSSEQDGNLQLQLLQVSDSLAVSGVTPMSQYQADEIFSKAYRDASQNLSALTSPYKDDYGTQMSVMAPIHHADGSIAAVFGLDYSYDKVDERLAAIRQKLFLISIAYIVFNLLLLIFVLRRAVKPLRDLVVSAEQAAKGDLTVTVPVVTGDEVGKAATSFNEMIASLRALTIHIDSTSQEVSDSSNALKETSGQAAAATHEIADSIQHVAAGADTQLASSQESQRAVTEMSIGIQKIAESSSVVSELAIQTTGLASEGENMINSTVEQIRAIGEHVFAALDAMQELNDSNQRIGDILGHISEVANQTNLLALNASIEAARAGEHGKGFAVVAHEIRKLAERSKQSSNEIGDIVHAISSRSEGLTASLSRSAAEVRSGTNLAMSSGEAFQAILQSIKEVTQQVQEVSAASEEMAASSEEIAASLSELERMAHTSASHTQQVAAASEEQLASVQEVASASEQLGVLAQQLREAVGRFKI